MNKELFKDIRDGLALILVMVIILTYCSGCTMSLNMVGSQGKAQDIVDEEQTNDPKVDPSLTIPSSVL
jgi:hypothetical protein